MTLILYLFDKDSNESENENQRNLESFKIKAIIIALLGLISTFVIFILGVRICRKNQLDDDY